MNLVAYDYSDGRCAKQSLGVYISADSLEHGTPSGSERGEVGHGAAGYKSASTIGRQSEDFQ